jgi:transcriptional repressor NF-X1
MHAITDGLQYCCNNRCNQALACGNHRCERICHPEACFCPYTPDQVTTCPCGRVPLRMLTKAGVRQECSDPIPTCLGRCRKSLECGHACQATCHEGGCPPCEEPIEMHCHCSSQATVAVCGHRSEVEHALECDRVCGHLLTCGRHRCSTVCVCVKDQLGVYLSSLDECTCRCAAQHVRSPRLSTLMHMHACNCVVVPWPVDASATCSATE